MISFQEIVDHKKITSAELKKDLSKLQKWDASTNRVKFCGNKVLYHFQLENLLRTRAVGKKLLSEILDDPEEYKALEQFVTDQGRTGTLPNRFFEAYRFNQAVVFFKPSTAKFIYKTFKATHVLDPTAGWGGRMLGASSLGISYTGIDTNTNLQDAYSGIMDLLQDKRMRMIWGDALRINFEAIDYDFVLTSPPYVNKKRQLVEVYENHPDQKDFYKDFLVPLIKKCLKHIKRNGKVCFNINKEMYEEVAKQFRPSDQVFDLLQAKRLGKNKEEKIYIWTNLEIGM
jgi:tRNA1(Val) A37 N6-methylase TrmN6